MRSISKGCRRIMGGVAGVVLLIAVLGALRARAADVVALRSGLPNFCRLMEEAQRGSPPVRIMYLGGAITMGKGASRDHLCYRALLTGQLRRLFPKSPLVEYNHAIAGTGSWLGAFRTSVDVVQHYLPLGLVLVEFAVDDAREPQQRVVAAMEGIVRQIRAAHPHAEILFVYAFSKDQLEASGKGQTPECIAWHEQVAAHYGLPSVNVAQFVAAKILAGQLKLEAFAADGVHPTDKGHALCLEAFKPLLEQCKPQPGSARVKYPLPRPLSRRPMDQAKLIAYEQAALEPGWRVGQESPLDERSYQSAVGKFRSVLVCDQAGPVATWRFRGDSVGYFDALGPDSGDLECSLDGGPWRLKVNFDQEARSGFRPHAGLLADNLDPAVVHELKLRVAAAVPAGSKGRTARIGYFLVNGASAAEDPYKGKTPLERIDGIYAAMAPLKYDPPAERWKYLPKTMKRLSEGPALRIVMLGDSIVNDTASSQYELLLERSYPKCKVAKIRSVRGSTGCWWYKEDNRVRQWVLDHNPDLLMIGGISQRDDVESIREVIRQVRQARPEVEVLLMTPAFGTTDPRTDKQWTYDADPNGSGYRSRLMRMAAEEKVEFLDMTGPWGRYIRESDQARGWFMRDPVHANERGFQILGRILEKYFGRMG